LKYGRSSFPLPLAFVLVKPGRNDRRVGHGLDIIEPFRHGLSFRQILFPLGPTLIP
jgi:hypothetical protein